MGGSEHLPCYTKGHGNTGKVQAACLHGGNNGHNDGYVALAHAGENADDEADTADNHGNGQGRCLEGYYDFVEHVSNG